MTNELDQLRRLMEARARATKEPWEAAESNINFVGTNTDDPMKCSGICMAYGGREVARPNMDFIALAGSLDLQAMLSAWERDREDLGRVVEMIGEACDAAARVEATQARHYLADLYESVKATLPKGTQ